MMNDPQHAPIRWSRILFLIVVAFALGEVVVRIGVERMVGQPFRSLDAYTFSGFGVYRQNARYTHPEFVHNSAGFRSTREFAIDKPSGTFRVMAFGSSVVYSGSAGTHEGTSPRIHTNETLTAYLEPLLKGSGALASYGDVEVINASINRALFRHLIPYYIAELGRYHSDVVLVFSNINDSYWVEHRGGTDKYYYDPNVPTPEEARINQLLNDPSLPAIAEKVVRSAVNRSALIAVGHRGVERVMERIHQRGAQMLRAPDAATIGVPELATKDEVDANIDRYLATLGVLLTYLESSGTQPVVFWEYLLLETEGIKPFTPYERDVANYLKAAGGGLSDEKKRLRRYVRDRTAAYLKARDVPMIDIVDDMKSYRGTLFNDYLHYNAEGNRWVAEVIARKLEPILERLPERRRQLTPWGRLGDYHAR